MKIIVYDVENSPLQLRKFIAVKDHQLLSKAKFIGVMSEDFEGFGPIPSRRFEHPKEANKIVCVWTEEDV